MDELSEEDFLAAKLGSPLALRMVIDFHRDRIQESQKKIEELTNPILKGLFGDAYYHCQIGIHNCEKSPFDICLYNNWTDGHWKHCVFCGQPNERK